MSNPANEITDWDPTLYEFDSKPAETSQLESGERIAVIRTSDRITFRRCRRRWGWSSHLRGNRGTLETPAPLWTGIGFHFAMEDFHGRKQWPSAADAFLAFATATYRKARHTLPSNYEEQIELATAMLNYYEHNWLSMRDPLQTYVHNGIPQAEVNFRIQVPWDPGRYGFDEVWYSGTIDRIIIDEWGRLWIVEYKTAKQIATLHFANDPQVSAYCWAAAHMYGLPIAGVIYQQHRKAIPEPPEFLASGRLTTNRSARTTRSLYKAALINLYGSVESAPLANVDHLNWLASQEDTDRDLYIRRDRIHRNDHQNQAEGAKILLEVEEMLNPDLPLYPNPTRDCQFLCPFNSPCVTIDDGGDWEYELMALTNEREGSYDIWRQYLPVPPNQQVQVQLQHLNQRLLELNPESPVQSP